MQNQLSLFTLLGYCQQRVNKNVWGCTWQLKSTQSLRISCWSITFWYTYKVLGITSQHERTKVNQIDQNSTRPRTEHFNPFSVKSSGQKWHLNCSEQREDYYQRNSLSVTRQWQIWRIVVQLAISPLSQPTLMGLQNKICPQLCLGGGGINVGPGPTWPRYLLKVGWVEGIYFRRLVASCCNWAILLKLCLPTECYPFTFIKGTTSKCEKITKITKFWHLCYVHVCMN